MIAMNVPLTSFLLLTPLGCLLPLLLDDCQPSEICPRLLSLPLSMQLLVVRRGLLSFNLFPFLATELWGRHGGARFDHLVQSGEFLVLLHDAVWIFHINELLHTFCFGLGGNKERNNVINSLFGINLIYL